MTLAAVKLWGRRIGAVAWTESAGTTFEYDPAFRESGIEVAPIHMPLGSRIYPFPALPEESFKGLPGMLADSLPDRYGEALVDAWLARQGRRPGSLDPVERLCYMGARGAGALEYEPATGPGQVSDEFDIAELVGLVDKVLSERETLHADLSEDGLHQILQVGTSAGGARPKAVIAWNETTGEVRSGQTAALDGFRTGY